MADQLPGALARVESGAWRIDGERGMVYATFETALYSYERPIGALLVGGYVAMWYRDETGKQQQVYAHRLIWTVCRGPIERGYVINHINSVRHDNRLANLELVTPSENIRHSYLRRPVGENHSSSKLTDRDAEEIRELLAAGHTHRVIADKFGVSGALISHVNTGRGRYGK